MFLKYVDYKVHLMIAGAIRLSLIAYGVYHDANFAVKYTDVDYTVFTDASRHVLNGDSPYDRHTFRYSPLIAFLLIPNVVLHNCFGKIMFSVVDMLVALLIRAIVKNSDGKPDEDAKPNFKYIRMRKRSKNSGRIKSDVELRADLSMMLWLYNPITLAIATRGNSDSIAGLLVLLTVYFLECKHKYFLAGIIHGISVHFRLYPIVYSLAMFMYLSSYSYYPKTKHTKTFDVVDKTEDPSERRTIFKKKYLSYIIPNFTQLKFITGFLIAITSLTYGFYYLYGYKFLYESYVYHLIRKDTRHNFSVYFYLQYLTAGIKNIGLWQKVLMVLPQVILLIVLSVRYGLNKASLNFAMLTTTITMVIYNTVLTSQYFVWILVVLPVCMWELRMSMKIGLFLLGIWLAAQGAWLMPAYFLEFRGQNTFLFVWLQSVSFFCANVAILGRLIMNYVPSKRKSKLCD